MFENMIRNMKLGFVVLLVSLLAACASTPEYAQDIEVQAESDPKVNLSSYKSYAWLGAAGVINDRAGRWEPPTFDVDGEVRFQIDQNLRAKGLSESSSGPEIAVAFSIGLDMEALKTVKIEGTNRGMIENVPQGALVVMLVDVATNMPIWVAAARAEVQEGADEATVKARIKYAVDTMFESYP
jgi:Domain of unknown function (DUF4136)